MLLEHRDDLDPAVLQACVPALTDPDPLPPGVTRPALRDPKQWEELVDELVLFTTDPQILGDAVEQNISAAEEFAGVREAVETYQAAGPNFRLFQPSVSAVRCAGREPRWESPAGAG